MENYREKLKLENRIYLLCILALILFAVLVYLAEIGVIAIAPVTGDSRWQSGWRGFCSGASFGFLGAITGTVLRNRKAIKNDDALKKLYIKEHDERTIHIRINAQSASQQIFLWVGLVATAISGYFNSTVSITILGCIFFVSILSILLTVYYKKRF